MCVAIANWRLPSGCEDRRTSDSPFQRPVEWPQLTNVSAAQRGASLSLSRKRSGFAARPSVSFAPAACGLARGCAFGRLGTRLTVLPSVSITPVSRCSQGFPVLTRTGNGCTSGSGNATGHGSKPTEPGNVSERFPLCEPVLRRLVRDVPECTRLSKSATPATFSSDLS